MKTKIEVEISKIKELKKGLPQYEEIHGVYIIKK